SVTNDIIVSHTARFCHVEFHYIFGTLVVTCFDHQLQKLFTLHRFTPSPYYSNSDSPQSSCRPAGLLPPGAVCSPWYFHILQNPGPYFRKQYPGYNRPTAVFFLILYILQRILFSPSVSS